MEPIVLQLLMDFLYCFTTFIINLKYRVLCCLTVRTLSE
jgi:hypothetical protein